MKNFTIIPNELLGESQLSIPSRYLYCVLLKYCGQDEWCFPSQNTLAKNLNCSERHIRNLIEELEGNELLYKVRRGFNRSNNYKPAKSLTYYRQSNGNSNSSHLGSMLPLHTGNEVPPKNTYLKAKAKRSVKGLEKLRESMEGKGIIPRSKKRIEQKVPFFGMQRNRVDSMLTKTLEGGSKKNEESSDFKRRKAKKLTTHH